MHQGDHAHAKLNLCLAVGPPEPAGGGSAPDRAGWHPIASWMHALALGDTLSLTDADHAIRWDDGGSIEWDLKDDLAVRALAAAGSDRAVDLTKRIPTGGGLGGGSSDAASALKLLGLPQDAALQHAAALGSDIAFFLDEDSDGSPPRPALVSGFGDRIARRQPQQHGVVLFVPQFGCSTPEVYKAFDELEQPESFEARAERAESLSVLDPLEHDRELFNDLEPAAVAVEPRLGTMLATLRRACMYPVHLTGSGSVSFALCPAGQEEDLAINLAVRLDNPDLRIIPTRLV